jgi:PAS domain-containing protein
MAERIRAHAWADTLGTIETWPISLRTTLGLMLDTSHAMCLAWGSELTFFYNDAYAKFLADRHPQALGRPFQEVWADEWKDIAPLVEQALRGEPVHFEDMHLAISRPGGVDDTWWTFSYSPARDDTGAIVGMLNVTTETTGKVLAIRETQGERERLAAAETLGRTLGVSRVGYGTIDPRRRNAARAARLERAGRGHAGRRRPTCANTAPSSTA